jgi:hypothetical protein
MQQDSRRLRPFLVELPAGGLDVRALVERAGAGGAHNRDGSNNGRPRFLRAIYVPDDGRCFLLYEGESAQAVAQAAIESGLGPVHVSAALAAGEGVEGRP